MTVFRFFKMTAVRYLGFVLLLLETTHQERLVVSIVVQNFVEIGYVVLKIYEFQRYASLARKCLFILLSGCFLW